MSLRRLASPLLLLCVLPGTALAASPSMPSFAETPLCFRGAPLPRCQGFLLTEFAATLGLPSSYRRPPLNAIWELGYMHNLEVESLALGGTLFLVHDDEQRTLFGIKPRLRRWLTPWLSAEVAPGILIGGGGVDSFAPSYPAFSGHAALNFGDVVSVSTQLEVLPLASKSNVNPQGREITGYIGLRFGSYAGLAAGPLVGFLIWRADKLQD
ncbi:hypothetical protein POL68_24400 [Stigmatella sp. ncwal1]|uniref:Uncharacterized protein n=1 Tax=Stigmatella ashevillensis TaxID=2995309 RepID=A0ABT5DH23_9BACT|nr:hypothetical protein [Stigmatella ashevillena]MDC0711632.1 hypothetical protein [Stigmatella ashevillena]